MATLNPQRRAVADGKNDDPDLLLSAAGGDTRAFERLYDRHSPIAFGLALRMAGGDRSEAEDIVQEAFLAIWRGAEGYDPSRASVRTWLLATVRNRAIDRLRSRARHDRRVEAATHEATLSPHDDTDLAERLHRDELGRRAKAALEQIDERQRTVIEMAYFEGLTQNEISERLGIPEGTVKSRMRLGLEHLRGSFRQAA